MMITKTTSINEIVLHHPSLIDTLELYGVKGLTNKHILKQVGPMTISDIMQKKGKNVDLFIEILNDKLSEKSVDLTLNTAEDNGTLSMLGLLPCPVRIPLLEGLNSLEEISNLNHTLKAASEGLDWLKESVQTARSEDELADIYISAGFDLFFEDNLMKQYKDQKIFKDYYSDRPLNTDFNNDQIQLQDPSKDYSMIGVVPAVFLVNTNELNGRPIPKTWNDLLNPIYKGSISLPVSDFDLFNAIMLHLYKEFGIQAIKTLGSQLIASMHPAQMVKSDRRSRVKPAISVMPYFFTKMALPGSVMKAVWPEDGAIISPIFMLTKEKKEKELKPYTDFFMSTKVAEILSHKGLFPSTKAGIDNKLVNPTFKWVGWDYINNNDVGSILANCMTQFEEGMNNNGSHNS